MLKYLSIRAYASDSSIVQKKLQQFYSGFLPVGQRGKVFGRRRRVRYRPAAVKKGFYEINDSAQPQQRYRLLATGNV
jgi:hypothetical protein